MLLKYNILYFCKKAAEMTAKLIRYIGFSLYNCLEMTVKRVWKTQGISFFQICKHPALMPMSESRGIR